MVELGSSLANSGGILKAYDPNTNICEGFEPFPLPLGTVGKSIQQLPNSDYVIIANNGNSYKISTN
ncbi:hypothetical protein N9H57_06645 [Flavobacteriaceae bacterium]|nr:hypothetical protein [Flavobacteriaceae bacterium]MDA8948798.1 hypothetical protein [Flavobacteriaceae bacterium]